MATVCPQIVVYFVLFLCISEDTLEEVKKKGRRRKNQRFETSQRSRKVNMGYGL